MNEWVTRWLEDQAYNPGSLEGQPEAVTPTSDLLDDWVAPEPSGDPLILDQLEVGLSAPIAANDLPLRGPCHPWIGIDCLPVEYQPPNVSLSDAEFAVEFASFLLWSKSGRQYGLCQRVLQPCACSTCQCGYCLGPLIRLPGPIAGILEIVENGVRWDESSYRRYGRTKLEATYGNYWPSGQNYDRSPYQLPDTENGETFYDSAWLIRYYQGQAVPRIASRMACLLATDISAFLNGDDCQIGGHVRRIVRGGVQAEYESVLDQLKDASSGWNTGIELVDQWLAEENPLKMKRRARVISPRDYQRSGWRTT